MCVCCILSDTILCYYSSWAQYRVKDAKFTVKDIPATMCSHLVYAFVQPNQDGGIQEFTDESTIRQMIDLKNVNPKLKILVAIGGADKGSTIFSTVI